MTTSGLGRRLALALLACSLGSACDSDQQPRDAREGDAATEQVDRPGSVDVPAVDVPAVDVPAVDVPADQLPAGEGGAFDGGTDLGPSPVDVADQLVTVDAVPADSTAPSPDAPTPDVPPDVAPPVDAPVAPVCNAVPTHPLTDAIFVSDLSTSGRLDLVMGNGFDVKVALNDRLGNNFTTLYLRAVANRQVLSTRPTETGASDRYEFSKTLAPGQYDFVVREERSGAVTIIYRLFFGRLTVCGDETFVIPPNPLPALKTRTVNVTGLDALGDGLQDLHLVFSRPDWTVHYRSPLVRSGGQGSAVMELPDEPLIAKLEYTRLPAEVPSFYTTTGKIRLSPSAGDPYSLAVPPVRRLFATISDPDASLIPGPGRTTSLVSCMEAPVGAYYTNAAITEFAFSEGATMGLYDRDPRNQMTLREGLTCSVSAAFQIRFGEGDPGTSGNAILRYPTFGHDTITVQADVQRNFVVPRLPRFVRLEGSVRDLQGRPRDGLIWSESLQLSTPGWDTRQVSHAARVGGGNFVLDVAPGSYGLVFVP